MRYLPNSPADRDAMLAATGHSHIDELFQQIHTDLRLKGKLNLPGPLSESEILDFFRQAAAESSRDYVSLLGAGAYSHYCPVVVDAMLSRGEFFTAYTPYQAEIAQGTLQAMFEFQTMMTQLTGQEVSNASLWDGSTATTEAALMAMRVTKRHRVVLARTLHPEYRQIVQTYVQNQDVELVEAPTRLPDKLTSPNWNPPWTPGPPPWSFSHPTSSAPWSAFRRLPPSPTARAPF
jgi:glycine dehydrogenase subunit 1